jgi:hypothetical protein
MAIEFIDVIDVSSTPDDGHYRTTSLALYKSDLGRLQVIGGLKHCTEITFDKTNAKKLIKFLEKLI